MQTLDDAARDIMRLNDKGAYTVPTHGLYPYQWNWDSAVAAFGFSCFDIDRAWCELETLFSGQWDNGMVPQILFHTPDDRYFPGPDVWRCAGPVPSSGISQPPLAATMAKFIFDKDPALGAVRMAQLFDRMAAWHDWFTTWRVDRGAIFATHPWETGRDNAPDWDGAMAAIDPAGIAPYKRCDTAHIDSAMRPTRYDYDRYVWLLQRGVDLGWDEAKMARDAPFKVADPLLTFTLLRAERDLAALGRTLGRNVGDIEARIERLEAGTQTLWNDRLGAYDARDMRSGQWANAISNASFLCWYAGLEAPRMRPVLARVMRDVAYGIPSLDPRDQRFDGLRYWRGPVWGVVNMLVGMGLSHMGLAEGETVRAATADLIARHGFCEYFDPRDGTGAGGGSFTWTAAVWLGWASPNAPGQAPIYNRKAPQRP